MKRCLVVGLCALVSAVAAAQDMPLSQVLVDGEPWRLAAEGYHFAESLAADQNGNVFFVDSPTSRILKIAATDGQVTTFAENTSGACGLFFGPDGQLYACQNVTKKVVRYDAAGRETAIADGINGNELIVDRSVNIFVTDMGGHQLWHIAPSGEKKVVKGGYHGYQPYGIAITHDESTVIVSDWERPQVFAYRYNGMGLLGSGSPYYSPVQMPSWSRDSGGAGVTVDDAERLFVCTNVGLQVFDPTGRPSGVILSPKSPSGALLANVIFGGPKFDTLYVTAGFVGNTAVYKRKTQTTGTPHYVWTPPKPKK